VIDQSMVLEVVATRHSLRASALAAALFEVQIRCLNVLIFQLGGLRRIFPITVDGENAYDDNTPSDTHC
jgi:hypothetical protein